MNELPKIKTWNMDTQNSPTAESEKQVAELILKDMAETDQTIKSAQQLADDIKWAGVNNQASGPLLGSAPGSSRVSFDIVDMLLRGRSTVFKAIVYSIIFTVGGYLYWLKYWSH